MKAAEGKIGRVFVIRLEDGDIIPTCLEQFAVEKEIKVALVTMISGVDSGNVISGPQESNQMPIDPIISAIDGAHELVAAGLIASDEEGNPKLHIHGAFARAGKVTGGCLRLGVKTWLVGEVVISEITGVDSKRILDKRSNFPLLEP